MGGMILMGRHNRAHNKGDLDAGPRSLPGPLVFSFEEEQTPSPSHLPS